MAEPAVPPLVEARNLVKRFPLGVTLVERLLRRRPGVVGAVEDVSLAVASGETLGVIGESGCGKSTLGRVLLKLHGATSGTIRFDGRDITAMNEAEFRPLRRRMQIVFQDPYASLNPRRTVGEIVGLPLRLHEGLDRRAAEERAAAFLPHVGLTSKHLRRYPHQFSGGQRQRIGIARALILNPDFVVCDEPVSALDVSIQAQIIELLQRFKAEFGLTYLFISHDLAVVGRVSNRIAVMYLGKIVETGPRDAILRAPAHPYTRALIAAAPRLRPTPGVERIRLVGDLPSPISPPSGCRFHTRCPAAMAVCAKIEPVETVLAPGHRVSCHLHPGGQG
jgi:oligopeptide/dipeptide ABC transporter ATP-binding protein